MVKVSIRVQSGAARVDVAVLAESAEQAMGLVRERYSTSNVRVGSPAGFEGISATGRAGLTPTDGPLQTGALVA